MPLENLLGHTAYFYPKKTSLSLLFSLYQTDIILHKLLKVVNYKRIWISSGLPAKLFLCIFHLQVQFYHFLWHQKILLWTKYLHFRLSKKLIMLGFCFKLEQMINYFLLKTLPLVQVYNCTILFGKVFW